MAQRRAAEAEAKAQAGAAEAEAKAQAGVAEAQALAQADAGADEAGADEAGADEADAGAYEAEAQAQADAGAYEAQLHQLQPELQQKEQQATDTQRLQHLQQQLQDLLQEELQRKEQQVAEQQQQLQQQQADMHLREQQLAEQQHQLQQQQANMQHREQQVAQQQQQVQQQQADLQQREQQVAQQQQQVQQQQADLQLRDQQVSQQKHQVQQQQADLQLREQQVAQQQQQVQQQQADLQLREQQVSQQKHQVQQQQADLQQREQQVAQQHHQVQLQQQLNRLQQQLEAQSGAELQRQVQQQLAAQQHLLQQQQADLLLKQQQVEKQPQEAAVQQAVSTHHPLPDHSTCSPQVPGSLRSPLFMRPRQDTTLAPMPRLHNVAHALRIPGLPYSEVGHQSAVLSNYRTLLRLLALLPDPTKRSSALLEARSTLRARQRESNPELIFQHSKQLVAKIGYLRVITPRRHNDATAAPKTYVLRNGELVEGQGEGRGDRCDAESATTGALSSRPPLMSLSPYRHETRPSQLCVPHYPRWAAGNEWEDKCPQYAAIIDTNCRAEIDTALGSLGLPKGISLTSPLLDDPTLLNTWSPLFDKEYSTGNVYNAFNRVSPSAACCFAVCQYNAQICTCLYSNDDWKSTVRRRLYSTAPVPVPPSPTALPVLPQPQPAPISSAAASSQANSVGGDSSNAVAKASAVSTGKLMATRSRIRGLMCSISINSIRFYDRDVSAALNIRRNAGPPRHA
ncbi:hypothetical protein QJQ45_009296 [Haematococcus lacustris]|nr:hypothetical protein QJQ45_009296 [Haematococcus lacustris]